MTVSKSVILLLSVLAVAASQSARSKRQVHLGVYPYGAHVLAEDDGSYYPGKYPDDPAPAPVAPVAPVVPAYPYAAPAYPYAAPAYPYAAPVPVAPVAPYAYHGADDGSYFPGKYGPENQ